MGGHRRGGHGPLRANVLLNGDIGNDRQHGVDHVPGAAQDRQGPCGQRAQDGDLLGVAAQDLLGELHHDVQAAGLLEGGGAADHRQDGEDDRHRWTAGLEPEGEDEDEEPDPGNQTEGHAATVGTDDEAGEDNDDLERNKHGGSAFKRCERVITDSICDV